MHDRKNPTKAASAARNALLAMKRFVDDRRGAFAMQFALMILPLMVCTGLAIDGGRAFLAKYELGQALDAAALAVGSSPTNDQAEMEVVAQRYLNLNYRGDMVEIPTVTVQRSEEIVTLQGSVEINTFFMPLIGRPTVAIAAASEVQRGGGNVEVVMALDITGSMSGSMGSLRTAANNLIDAVVKTDTHVNGDQAVFYSRAAIVPWTNNLHVGATRALAFRGPIRAATTITSTEGRIGGRQSVEKAYWREGAEQTISAAAWKNGSQLTMNSISKANEAVVATSANHGYTTGEFVYITTTSGWSSKFDKKIFMVETTGNAKQFKLKDVDGTAYINTNSSDWSATAGKVQRCYNKFCQIRVTTSNNHNFTNDSLVYIKGAKVMTAINSPTAAAEDMTWTIAVADSKIFYITELDGPTITTTYTANSGKASWCAVQSCRVQVKTYSLHGFAAGNFVNIVGSSDAAYLGKGVNASWVVDTNGVTDYTFQLANTGPTFSTAADAAPSGSQATRCVIASCEVKVTSAGHGMAENEYVKLSGVTHITDIATPDYWKVSQITSNSFVLAGSKAVTYAPNAGADTGTVTCLANGCQTIRYIKGGTTSMATPKTITDCVSERVGDQAYTDAPPGAGAYVGNYYAAGGENYCETSNTVIPLTNDKVALKKVITDMDEAGSTGGQIGVAWGWYMLSPRWGAVWDDFNDGVSGSTTQYYRPSAYKAAKTSKVLVLMTDGEFNSAHCNGVISNNYAYTSGGAEKINCNATNGSPFTQAQTLCTNMKASGYDITIYTVGFRITEGSTAAQFLSACASSTDNYYLASDSTALSDAFAKIAKSINKLRISK